MAINAINAILLYRDTAKWPREANRCYFDNNYVALANLLNDVASVYASRVLMH